MKNLKRFSKLLLLLPNIFCCTFILYAQPTITSFSPKAATLGSYDTIVGTNFNTTSTNNIVFFGAVKAPIISVSSTQLVVTVPAGASYGPIQVTDTTTGLTALSKLYFCPTFTSFSGLSQGTFSTAVSFPTGYINGSYPNGLKIVDIDGDGKTDITGCGINTSKYRISTLRNITSSGTINSSSFITHVLSSNGFTSSSGDPVYLVKCIDLNGDGKQDEIWSQDGNNSASLYLYNNNSTAGNITATSFGGPITLTARDDAEQVDVCDIDGDGKLDIACTNLGTNNGYGGITLFRNTGSTSAISFSAGVTVSTSILTSYVQFADLDGDGKPDLIFSSGSTIYISKNTATSGTITTSSFATPTSYTCLGTVSVIKIFDQDGDGKLDIVTAAGGVVSVFRNTSLLFGM